MACSPLLHSLSRNNLGAAGAAALAPALAANGSLTALNLSSNQIGGYERRRYTDAFSVNHGYEGWIRTPEGPKAVADALLVNNSLTSLDLSSNNLCGVSDWGSGTYTTEGITAIADALRVNGALTSLDVRSNKIAGDGAAQLSAAVLGNLKIEIFNEIPIKEMHANSITELAIQSNKETKLASLNFGDNSIGPVGANAVAAMVAVTGSLTKMRYVSPRTNLSEFGPFSEPIHER